MTFTKEQLIAAAMSRIEFLEMMLTGEPESLKERALAIELQLARMALSGMEAEPVIDRRSICDNVHGKCSRIPGATFYNAAEFAIDEVEACRAAMLQGADGTLADEGTIPAMLFKPVADLYGLTSPTGGEASFTFDAVEARDFIDGGWSCQEYVELGRFQEAMLQNGNSPAQSDCCPEQNYIAPAQDGDSPVIPDGWVMVPEEPTHEMLEAGDEQFGTYDVYRRMLAAAPQQEAE
ncbi:TPA: hypothetical protein IHD35_000548 [Escherichia coli]|nr:hypothetical protein [Escherichia coli]